MLRTPTLRAAAAAHCLRTRHLRPRPGQHHTAAARQAGRQAGRPVGPRTRRTAADTNLQPTPMAFSSTVRRPRALGERCCWVRIQALSVSGSVCGGAGGGGTGVAAAAAMRRSTPKRQAWDARSRGGDHPAHQGVSARPCNRRGRGVLRRGAPPAERPTSRPAPALSPPRSATDLTSAAATASTCDAEVAIVLLSPDPKLAGRWRWQELRG